MDEKTWQNKTGTASAIKFSPAESRGSYYPAFDYLRIVTALGVFAHHADHSGIITEQFGNSCVQVFFALSGFLICGVLLRSSKYDLSKFYFNRTARIWIPYSLAVLLLLAVTLIKQKLGDPKLWEFYLYFVTFDYNWFGPRQLAEFGARMPLQGTGNHFWSICVEEQFYLAAPFVILLTPRAVSLALFSIIFVANCIYPLWFGSISLGVLLAFSKERFGEWYLTTPARLLIVLCGTVLTICIWLEYLPYAATVPAIAITIVALLAYRGSPSPGGRVLGGMSFSFYLNHWVGLFAANFFNRIISLNYMISAVLGLLIALAMSLAHYEYVDRWIAANRSRYFTVERGLVALAAGIGLVSIGAAMGIYILRFPLP